MKRKGLVEHLIRTSQQPKGQHEAYGPRQRPFIRRSKTSLDNLTVLRKKETIIKSGAYERSQIAPPKGKGNSWYLEWQLVDINVLKSFNCRNKRQRKGQIDTSNGVQL